MNAAVKLMANKLIARRVPFAFCREIRKIQCPPCNPKPPRKSQDFRIPLKGKHIRWRILDKLLDHADGFYRELLQHKKSGKAGVLKVKTSEKLRKLKPWWPSVATRGRWLAEG